MQGISEQRLDLNPWVLNVEKNQNSKTCLEQHKKKLFSLKSKWFKWSKNTNKTMKKKKKWLVNKIFNGCTLIKQEDMEYLAKHSKTRGVNMLNNNENIHLQKNVTTFITILQNLPLQMDWKNSVVKSDFSAQ